jgi:hypothetical protein
MWLLIWWWFSPGDMNIIISCMMKHLQCIYKRMGHSNFHQLLWLGIILQGCIFNIWHTHPQ